MTLLATSARSRWRPGRGLAFAVLVVLLLISIGTALRLGSVALPLDDVLAVVTRRLGLGSSQVTLLDDQIVWQLRMPRVLAAAACGAGLAVCGAVLQSLTRNDLADPYLLGISGGAAVGAVSVIVLGAGVAGLSGTSLLAAAAFLGAMAALVLVLVLATGRSGSLPPSRTVLAGVAVGELCAAYTAFVVIVSGQNDAARRVLAWTLGSFAGVRWSIAVLLMVVVVLAVVGALGYAAHLDAFAFGETAARSLGVPTERVRWTLMIGTALLTACLVAYTGAIGFVGLVVPHMVRLVFGPGHRRLIPLGALTGAILLVWADTVARTVMPGQEIPVGVVTAAVGAPVFALLLRREARQG
ncbi:iron ABC transporter permease [Nocardioides marmoriginsengisoli]|uniref:Iron ABC transporter permease n=1 Tax=Nocardioides marmoriginsengisoli TaxID=661483 RepID=A0A3N0CNH7_9ACTN|nr:iron chelate uptake ABC transporter family permease subunit [Nocardioides marmoriginsengisoli]RNL64899.1 iron ABC transporter permease [Nocardioides marmoriginsengisoli]